MCRSKYGGVEVSEAKPLKPLEDENSNLNRDRRPTGRFDPTMLKDLVGGLRIGVQARTVTSEHSRSRHAPEVIGKVKA